MGKGRETQPSSAEIHPEAAEVETSQAALFTVRQSLKARRPQTGVGGLGLILSNDSCLLIRSSLPFTVTFLLE